MSLKPAIKIDGTLYIGRQTDSHDSLASRERLEGVKEDQKGFSPDDKLFLTRRMAMNWLRANEPAVFKALAKEAPSDGLHTGIYRKAKGIAEDKRPESIDLSKKTALVYDMGLFTENACRLGRDCAEVWYYTPWQDAFPEPFQSKIGEGLDGIERISSFEERLDEADFIFVPDTLCAGLVEWLKKHGYPTAGAGAAEKLELDRWYGRTQQKGNGLPVQETNKVKGITALREFTRGHENYWVKIDAFRGLEESWSYTDEKDCEQTIDRIAAKLGPYKEDIVFILEEKLPGTEPGIDFITFDGELVYPTMIGYESKGVGIIERVYSTESDLPDAAKWVFEGFSPEFKKHRTRFFGSLEFIIGKDRIPYVIDPSIRLAAPGVAAIQTELFENYSQVVYGLATGQKVAPVTKHKYAAAAAMESSAANTEWVNISFPKELRQWIKFRMAVKKGRDYYAVPGFDSVGTILGFGDTVKAALDQVKERAEQVSGKRLSKGVQELENLQKSIEEGKEYGIDF